MAFVPLFAVFILVILHAVQWVAWFEVKRANLFLRREIRVVDQWFSYRFFSWMGVKERLLSPRSWLTIVYTLVSFVIGVIGFSLSPTILVLFVTALAVPIGAIAAWLAGNIAVSDDVDLISVPHCLPVATHFLRCGCSLSLPCWGQSWPGRHGRLFGWKNSIANVSAHHLKGPLHGGLSVLLELQRQSFLSPTSSCRGVRERAY